MSRNVRQKNGSAHQAVSNSKVQANRKNATKSTGPKTPRGKAFSRRNSLKHGLFVMNPYVAAVTDWEDPDEYQNLLDRLTECYKPVGAAEELEVQQIAVCWWKRSRAWRFENAHIHGEIAKRRTVLDTPEALPEKQQTYFRWLTTAASEIEETGKISDELENTMFTDAGFRQLWNFSEENLFELAARKMGLRAPRISEHRAGNLRQESEVRLAIARHAKRVLVDQYAMASATGTQLALEAAAIPPVDVLDRILRVEAATDRSLSRSMDRLDRLQRSRMGALLPCDLSQ